MCSFHEPVGYSVRRAGEGGIMMRCLLPLRHHVEASAQGPEEDIKPPN